MRRFAGAVHTYLDLMELASRNYLPLDLRKDADAQRLAMAANNVACWSNDVYSAKKELGYGDVHNLVVVIMHERQKTFGEALALAVTQCDDEVREFIAVERRAVRTARRRRAGLPLLRRPARDHARQHRVVDHHAPLRRRRPRRHARRLAPRATRAEARAPSASPRRRHRSS